MSNPIYVDYAAATPLDARVLAAMQPYFGEQFFNPSSSYLAAKQVRQALEDARTRVAHWLGSRPAEIVFTAGATESINLAIHGIMRRFPSGHMLLPALEHEAVLGAAKAYEHDFIPVNPDGIVNLDALKHAITDKTVFVSIGYANNEIGTIQPLKEITRTLQEARRLRQLKNNKTPLYFHTDASQSGCYLDLHISQLGVDLLTLNGGKMYGPKQSGVLFVRGGLELQPLISGGGQEGGLRSGTENVAACIGLATALDIAQTERREAILKASKLRDELERQLAQAFPNMQVNGNPKKRLPNNLHVSWPGIDGERLLMLLDEHGIMASTGSACAANKQTASHVLQAIGLDEALIQGSLRLTVGRDTTPAQVNRIAATVITDVRDARGA